jgi:hypothetical protein
MATIHQLPLPGNPSIAPLIGALRRARRGARIELLGYRPSGGGMIDYSIAACSYGDVARASLETLSDLTPEALARCCEILDGDVALAREVLATVRESWARAAERDPEELPADAPAPGLVRHAGRDGLYLSGLVIHRRELMPPRAGRLRKSSRRTLARRWLEDRTPAGAWRQFRLGDHNWAEIRLPGERVRNVAPALLAHEAPLELSAG